MNDATIFTLAMFIAGWLPFLIIPLVVVLIARVVRRGGGGGGALHSLPRPVARFGCAMLLVVPVCAFCGLMVATAGGAIHPPLVTVAAPYVCDGTVEALSHNYSYKPGQQGVARVIFCLGADGSSRDITLRTIGAATVYYTLIFLAAALVLMVLRRLLKPRRATGGHVGADARTADARGSALADRLRVDADIVRRPMRTPDPRRGQVEERLRHLVSLRDAGLISETEYQASRAAILSDL
ncbi:SHOCT domain-containing protein [Hephaestia sp. GCM10023244]|uniref:SHOCT domain-containing protein n=1 Tax=unclassified Hephaestia TaxID=2631281 RepID=UPI002077405E|nr:SHOCT domain-containing protein [Hephaestia sp. MAHUQ-44]MCM8730887.1 SHOCT domain-containing protein [Hephaestia sp. MAHUQ-44]